MKLFGGSLLLIGSVLLNISALAAGEIPAATGKWTSWHNVLSFNPGDIKNNSSGLQLSNGMVFPYASYLSSTTSTAYPYPGVLVPAEQCDYRLKLTGNQGKFNEFVALQNSRKTQSALSLVFNQNTLGNTQLLTAKNINLNFTLWAGEYYSSLQVTSDELKIHPAGQNSIEGQWLDAKYYLQRRCFVADPVLPVAVSANSGLSSK